MRVRNDKIEIFEKNTSHTEKFVLVIGNFVFILMLIWLWILMYELYKVIWDLKLVIILWSAFSWALFLTFIWLKNASLEDKIIIKKSKIKKWINGNFVRNINVLNHQNYFKPNTFYTYFLKQKLREKIWLKIIIISPTIWLFWLFYTLSIHWKSILYGEFYTNLVGFLMFFTFPVIFYYYFVVFQIKKAMESWNIYLMRSEITSYYVDENKIFFY